jgi:hypothetical protein
MSQVLSDFARGVVPATTRLQEWPMERLEQFAILQCAVTSTLECYCEATMENGPGSVEWCCDLGTLSGTEKTRLLRACYHLELYHRLFSTNLPGSRWPQGADPPFDCYQQAEKYLGILPPWQAEEMVCVYEFMIRSYDSMMHAINDQAKQEASTRCRKRGSVPDYVSDGSDDDYAEDGKSSMRLSSKRRYTDAF